MSKKQKISQEKKEILSKFLGKKLAFLILGLKVSNYTKELLVEILPSLSNQELAKLIQVLEEKFSYEMTDFNELVLEQELFEILSKHNKANDRIDKQSLKKMDKLFKS